MRRATGKHSLWDRKPLPARNPDGTTTRCDARWWLAVRAARRGLRLPLGGGAADLPAAALRGLCATCFHGTLTRNQAIFLSAGTIVLSIEFLFARHLFCRYGCAVGLFQSLAWMSNRDAMVVGFERERAADCATAEATAAPATTVCPMRLKPRNIKRAMFTCTQCAQCIAACEHRAARQPERLAARLGQQRGRAAERSGDVGLTGQRERD